MRGGRIIKFPIFPEFKLVCIILEREGRGAIIYGLSTSSSDILCFDGFPHWGEQTPLVILCVLNKYFALICDTLSDENLRFTLRNKVMNTSLAAPGALAHCLQCRTNPIMLQ